VVDVNLDCAATAACPADGGCDLNAFFSAYRGPPLVLVRGLYMETAPNAEPKVRMSHTAYEDAIASNPNILWAHTMYLTDGDGTVRHWRDAWEACSDDGTETVLAVPLRVAAALTGQGSIAQAPPRTGQCTFAAQTSPQHLLILGAPIIGQAQFNTSGPRVLPARHLLDPDRTIEASGYFSLAGRVVIIGATHAASGDVWRTPIGLMPGMELIAHTLRFAPTQIDPLGAPAISKPIVLTAFWTLVVLAFFLRPSLVVLLAVVLSFIAIYVATGVFGRFDVFESLALSLWIFIEFAVAIAFWELFWEVGVYRNWRTLRVLLAKRIRSKDPETK
jgi:CHASE2 domain-containing sensor protein